MKKILLVDFSFDKYVSSVRCVSSFTAPSKLRRLFALFTHRMILSENPALEIEVSEADVVILFDTRKNYDEVAKRIEKVSRPENKLIFYSWNPIQDSDAHERLSVRWIKTTFSKRDAACCGFKFVGSFYFMRTHVREKLIRWDGFFVGCEKGRREMLQNVADLYGRNHMQARIVVVDNRKAWYDWRYSWRVGYDEICESVQESRSVIEILQEGQEGVSLRVFEALFYQKKLVTNNWQIVNYDFYDPRNVFILGKDDESRFNEFLLSPYVEIDEKVIAQYRMESWLNKMVSI